MVIAVFKPEDIVTAAYGLWQWNYGQVLRIQGLRLPAAVEIHFSLQEYVDEAVTRVGTTKDGVTEVPIPDNMLEGNGASGASYDIFVFIYLTDETSGQTEYKIRLQVKTRPKPEGFKAPGDTELFRDAIAAVNDAAARAENAEESAEAWAHGREDYPDRAEDNAAYYAEKAADSQEAAAASEKAAQDAEASSQESAQAAELSAGQAAQSAAEASGYMQQAQTAAGNALLSEQEAKNAKNAAESAQTGAETAENQAEQHAIQTTADREAVESAKELIQQMEQEVTDNKAAVEQTAAEFNVTAQQAVNTVNAAGQEQVNQINAAGSEQVQAVNDAGTGQVQSINNAGATQTQAVNAAGSTQVQAVEEEGTQQVANVQEAAAEIVADRDQIEMNWDLASSAAPGIVQAVEGKNIVVTDSAARPLQGLRLFGKSRQKTTAGIQLAKWPKEDTTVNIDWSVAGNGVNDGAIYIPVFVDKIEDMLITFDAEELELSSDETADSYIYFGMSFETSSDQIWYAGETRPIAKKMSYTYTANRFPDINFEDVKSVRVQLRRSKTNTMFKCTVKNLLLKYGTDPADFEPYTGREVSPNPDYPQIVTNAGQVLTAGKQLFDANAITPDVFIDLNTGELLSVSGYWTSDYIPVKASTVYSISLTGSSRFVYFNAEKEFILGTNISGGTFAPDNDGYIRFSGTYDANSIMVNAGSSLLPWEPYSDGVADAVDLGIDTELYGLNLLDPQKYTFSNSVNTNGVTITTNDDGSLTTTGTPSISSGIIFTLYLSRDLDIFADGVTYKVKDANMVIAYNDGRPNAYTTSVLINKHEIKSIGVYIQRSVSTYVNGETIYPALTIESAPINFEPYKQKQSLRLFFKGGLLGIPVSSGGNYTDENGQQWICDEVDLDRGVLVKRINNVFYNGETINTSIQNNIRRFIIRYMCPGSSEVPNSLFNIFSFSQEPITTNLLNNAASVYHDDCIYVRCDKAETVDEFKKIIQESSLSCWYVLATPEEIPLTAVQIAAFRALRMNQPATTIMNDADAWMKAEYIRDPETIQKENQEEVEAVSERLGDLSFAINAEDGGLDLIYEKEVHNA